MSIPFVQFLRPDGRQVNVEVDRPEPIELKALKIAPKVRFEIEQLSNGVINMEAMDRATGDCLCGELAENGPPVLDAVDRLVNKAAELVGD